MASFSTEKTPLQAPVSQTSMASSENTPLQHTVYQTIPSVASRQKESSKVVPIILAVVAGVIIGFLIGWMVSGSGSPVNVEFDLDLDFEQKQVFNEEIKASNIRDNLKRFTSYPHLAGTEGEQRLADDLEAIWKEQGMEYVTQSVYDVLLSYPDRSDPSVVQLLSQEGDVLFTSQIQEKNLTQDQNHEDIVMPYNTHSPAGDVTAPLVFVNYGRIEDFQRMRDEYNFNFTGTIAIAKYGKIFRADKVTFAAQFGCKGVIVYSDPADYNQGPQAPYPESWWLPPTGVQRGAMFALKGDPITPGYPAIESAYRWAEEEVDGLPQIPVHPICYSDAEQLLKSLAGAEAPSEWQGGLSLTYRLGPSKPNSLVRLRVTTSNQRAKTSDVFAVIKGSVEPDRYVLLGNHRDAWVLGGIDPNSGTAVMMEVSRTLGVMLKQGWRPRRTIIFCSWGAEEPGLIGSYEWVENYVRNLGDRAVVYINMDSAVSGNSTFRASGVPMFNDALYQVTQKIVTPNNPQQSMYEEWLALYPDTATGKPKIDSLGAGSDHAPFINTAGVSAIDIKYTYDPALGLSSTPCYHSAYETFFLFDNYIDPGFKYSKAMGELSRELIRYFAETPLLRVVNVTAYGEALTSYIQQLEQKSGQLMATNGISLDGLRSEIEKFGLIARDFQQRIQAVNETNELAVRQYNDQLMYLERAFIDPKGVPQQTLYKHLISAPSKFDSYSGGAFPGLGNLLFDVESLADPSQRWEEVKQHLATLNFVIQSAASTLKPVTKFH